MRKLLLILPILLLAVGCYRPLPPDAYQKECKRILLEAKAGNITPEYAKQRLHRARKMHNDWKVNQSRIDKLEKEYCR